jgi:RAB protein geranylgeranyltransferase component A
MDLYRFENPNFDYIVLGTDISESIISGVLCHRKNSVLIVDFDDFYSGTLKCFHTRDLLKISKTITDPKIQKEPLIRNFEFKSDSESFKNLEECVEKMKWRGYSMEWDSKLIVSDGKATDELISISIDDYVNFRGLKEIFVKIGAEDLISLPLEKSAILGTKGLSLFEKKKIYDMIMTLQKIYVGCMLGKANVNSINELEKDIYQMKQEEVVDKGRMVLEEDFKELLKVVEGHLFSSKGFVIVFFLLFWLFMLFLQFFFLGFMG